MKEETVEITLIFTPSQSFTRTFTGKKSDLTTSVVRTLFSRDMMMNRNPYDLKLRFWTWNVAWMVFAIDGVECSRKLHTKRWLGFPEVLQEAQRSVTIGWAREIWIYEAKPSSSKLVEIAVRNWRSDESRPFEEWLQPCWVQSTHQALDSSSHHVLTEAAFFRTFAPRFDVYSVPRRSSYCSLAPAALLELVEVFEGDTPPVGTKRNAITARLDAREQRCELLDRMIEAGDQRLMVNVKQSISLDPTKQAQWDDLCSLVHRKLTMLNNRHQPSSTVPESVRRLVIDEFITAVTEFTKMEFSVEEMILEGDRQKSRVGWGPLDYCLFKPADGSPTFVLAVATEPVKEEDEDDGQWRQMPLPVGHTGTEQALYDALADALQHNNTQMPHLAKAIEAKRAFNDQTLTQLGAQLYDCLKVQKARDSSQDISIHGCLCTGHRWLFVEMSWSAASPDSRPVFARIGQVEVKVLRAASHEIGRQSGCLLRQHTSVDKKNVEKVMLALYASLAK